MPTETGDPTPPLPEGSEDESRRGQRLKTIVLVATAVLVLTTLAIGLIAMSR